MTSRARVSLFTLAILLSAVAPAAAVADETQELIGVLRSDASTYDKSQACQRLAAVGGEPAVPALAALLSDEQLGAYARSALEAIGGAEVGAALIEALGHLDGNLRIGAINSLGVLREPKAVEALAPIVHGDDADAARGALEALGRIGTPGARETLLWALVSGPAERRAAAAEACLVYGDLHATQGRPAEAVKVYYRIRQADVPNHLRLAATCRTMVARQAAGLPLLAELLTSGDQATVAMALRAVREMPGPQVTEALLDELAEAPPSLQVVLIPALAERGDDRAWAAIKALAASDDRDVRLAALSALGPVDTSLLRFVPLFDGKTFDGWEGDTEKSFRIEDGAIVGGSLNAPVPRNEFLCTTRTYANFILRVECKVVDANGGVQFRSQRVPDSAEVSGYQADMDNASRYWGCLYDESRRGMLVQLDAAEVERLAKPDDWNAYEIRCEGQRIRLFLNGEQTVDYTEADGNIPVQGAIGLQVHGGPPSETWYRNLTIAELP